MKPDSKVKTLVAMPSLDGGIFKNSVIALLNGSGNREVGVILNIRVKSNLGDVLSRMKIELEELMDKPLSLGGPVSPEFFWCVHGSNRAYSATIELNEELNFSPAGDVLEDLVNGVETAVFRFGLAYSGWGENQLQREIEEGMWWLADCPASLVFGSKPEELWKAVFTHLGIDPNGNFMDGGLGSALPN